MSPWDLLMGPYAPNVRQDIVVGALTMEMGSKSPVYSRTMHFKCDIWPFFSPF